MAPVINDYSSHIKSRERDFVAFDPGWPALTYFLLLFQNVPWAFVGVVLKTCLGLGPHPSLNHDSAFTNVHCKERLLWLREVRTTFAYESKHRYLEAWAYYHYILGCNQAYITIIGLHIYSLPPMERTLNPFRRQLIISNSQVTIIMAFSSVPSAEPTRLQGIAPNSQSHG